MRETGAREAFAAQERYAHRHNVAAGTEVSRFAFVRRTAARSVSVQRIQLSLCECAQRGTQHGGAARAARMRPLAQSWTPAADFDAPSLPLSAEELAQIALRQQQQMQINGPQFDPRTGNRPARAKGRRTIDHFGPVARYDAARTMQTRPGDAQAMRAQANYVIDVRATTAAHLTDALAAAARRVRIGCALALHPLRAHIHQQDAVSRQLCLRPSFRIM